MDRLFFCCYTLKMKHIQRFFLALSTAMLFFSCASNPATVVPKQTITLIPQALVKNGVLGNQQDENPYIEPASLIFGKKNEFVVLRLDIASPDDVYVDFNAEVILEDTTVGATQKTKEDMIQFWAEPEDYRDPTAKKAQVEKGLWDGGSPNLNTQRRITLDQTYLPAPNFVMKKGTHSYYVVLMGKYPIQRPAKLHARLQVGEQLPIIIDMDLPEASRNKILGLF